MTTPADPSAVPLLRPASPLPRFAVKPFTPDNGVNGAGVMMLVGALVITGGVVGFIAHLIAQFFYLIILFPVLIGLALGGVGMLMVRKGRLRNAWIGGLAGFVGGVLAMGMMHYFDYKTFRADVDKELPFVKELAPLAPAELDVELEGAEEADYLRRLTKGYASFPGYMNYSAEEGVQIKGTRGSSSSKGINLGYIGSWVYWVIETLIVAGVTFVTVRRETQKPYCRACDDWRIERVIGGFTGDPALATAGVTSGDLNDIAAAQPGPYGAVTLSSATCVACRDVEPAADLKLEHVTVDGKGNQQKKTLAQATWPATALPALTALFQAPPEAEAVPYAAPVA